MISVKITARCNQQNDSTGSDTLLLKINNVERSRLDINTGETRVFRSDPINEGSGENFLISIGDNITIWESDLLDADDQLCDYTVDESDESATKSQAHIGEGDYIFTFEFA